VRREESLSARWKSRRDLLLFESSGNVGESFVNGVVVVVAREMARVSAKQGRRYLVLLREF